MTVNSFEGGSMGLTQLVAHHDESQPSDEARERINSARVRDLAFLVKRVSQRELDSASTHSLASALAEIEGEQANISKRAVEAKLRSQGYNAEEASLLSSAIIR